MGSLVVRHKLELLYIGEIVFENLLNFVLTGISSSTYACDSYSCDNSDYTDGGKHLAVHANITHDQKP